jgi:hypothetical protein
MVVSQSTRSYRVMRPNGDINTVPFLHLGNLDRREIDLSIARRKRDHKCGGVVLRVPLGVAGSIPLGDYCECTKCAAWSIGKWPKGCK